MCCCCLANSLLIALYISGSVSDRFFSKKSHLTVAEGEITICGVCVETDDYSGNSPTGLFVKNKDQNYKKGKVKIGSFSIIGSGTVILPKITIAKKCSIGALSLVNKNLSKSGVYAGIPCKRINYTRT